MDGDEEEDTDDDDEHGEINGKEKREFEEEDDEKDENSRSKKKIKKNPDVDTSFLPDREREEEETRLREELRQVRSLLNFLFFEYNFSNFKHFQLVFIIVLLQEWTAKQNSLKEEPIEITFSYWDGSGHRKTIKMKKGDFFSLITWFSKIKLQLQN